MIARRILIRGKVQGVWFRKHTSDKANELGIRGEVWNKDDGSVAIEAFGSKEQLAKLEAWCHKGPPLSRVDSVEESALNRTQWPDSFEVRY